MKFLINQYLYIKNLLLTHFTLTNKGYKYILTFLNANSEDNDQNIFKVTGYRVDRWRLFLGCDGGDSFSFVRFECKWIATSLDLTKSMTIDRWCLFLGCDGEDSFSYVRFECKWIVIGLGLTQSLTITWKVYNEFVATLQQLQFSSLILSFFCVNSWITSWCGWANFWITFYYQTFFLFFKFFHFSKCMKQYRENMTI